MLMVQVFENQLSSFFQWLHCRSNLQGDALKYSKGSKLNCHDDINELSTGCLGYRVELQRFYFLLL